MKKRYYNNDLVLHIVLLLLCAAPVLISFVLYTDGRFTTFRFPAPVDVFGIPCAFTSTTGYNCPVCGMTRCFVYMSTLNIEAAWEMNKAGVLLYVFCLLQIPYRLLLIIGLKIPRHNYLILFEALHLAVIGIIALEEFVVQFVNIV